MHQAKWYVVQTQPNAEHKAAAHLSRQGFDTYLPRYRKRRRHARRVDTVTAPLFPRYVFVAVDVTTQRWRAIQSTAGVSRLICNGDVPAVVPDGVVDGIKRRQDETGFIHLDERARFHSGDAIRVLDGVFEASFGIVEGTSDSERVMILLDLLGRKVRVSIDADIVAAA